MIKVGLIGYGKAGMAVARVLASTPGVRLCWIAKRQIPSAVDAWTVEGVPLISLTAATLEQTLQCHPVDALVDFSSAAALHIYGELVRQRQLMLVTAISAYGEDDQWYLQDLGRDTRIMASPNITLGINFLIFNC